MSNENITQGGVNTSPKSSKRRARIWDVFVYLLCLVAALGIWAYVTTSEAEEYEYQFTGVVVDLEGVAAMADGSNLSPISGEGHEITVTVRGSRKEISKYTEEDIFAYVDLSSITTASHHSLEVHIDLPGNIQLVSASPSKISVFVDEMVSKQVPIEVDMIYSAESNVTILEPTINGEGKEDDLITVTGPKSVVDYISYARVTKDVGKITMGVHFTSPFVLIDNAGEEVTNRYVKTNVNDVSVNVDVKVRKSVPVVAVFDINPDDPYVYTVKLERDTVDIVALAEIAAGYDVITVKINNISDTRDGSVVLPITEGVEMYVGDQPVAVLVYTVEKQLRGE